jgi:PAS domain S-box-containing protein
LGYRKSELLGRSIAEVTHPEDEDEARMAQQALQADGSYYRADRRFLTKSGASVWASLLITFVGTNDSDPPYGLAMVADIHERKRTEEALRTSLETSRALLNVPIGSAILMELDGTIVALNSTAVERLPGDAGDLLGRSIYDLMPPETARSRKAAIRWVEASAEPDRIEERTSDGWFITRIYPVLDDRGSVARVALYIRDITRLRHAEAALEESQSTVGALLTGTPDMVFRMNADATFLDFLPASNLDPLVPPGEFIGKRAADVLPVDVAEQVKRKIELALRTDELQELEYDLTTERGLESFEARIAPIGGDEVLAIVRDVTARRRAQDDLERLRDELETRVEKTVSTDAAYGLSFRELTVLSLAAEGCSDKEIASILGISHRTVQTHITHILQKMDASNRAEASARAQREGLLG